MSAEEKMMDGGPHRLAVEFQGGPADGLQGFVTVGKDKVRVKLGRDGAEHRYEFDPVTTEAGYWIYRHRGPVAPVEGGAA
ncbi:MAG: hypothetical protein RLZZ408_139 [Verrucomicrobiota bacterium]|jgi:hypothetical protein